MKCGKLSSKRKMGKHWVSWIWSLSRVIFIWFSHQTNNCWRRRWTKKITIASKKKKKIALEIFQKTLIFIRENLIKDCSHDVGDAEDLLHCRNLCDSFSSFHAIFLISRNRKRKMQGEFSSPPPSDFSKIKNKTISINLNDDNDDDDLG